MQDGHAGVKAASKTLESKESNTSGVDIVRTMQLGEDVRSLLKTCSIAELENLSSAIRQKILDTVSKNGGHLSSTLGAVELIVGMHAVFDCKENPFIFDVSHQAYAHKLLSGRYRDFHTLRQFNGISGFTSPSESECDYFVAGHSSTSLSLAVGVSKAAMLKNKSANYPVVMIGDGSMSAGLVYEALNELGDLKLPMIIILNDNEMSIAKPIGVMSKILSKTIASPLYQNIKERIKKVLDKMPEGATFIAKRFEESLKLITPGLLFEEFGIDYIGPIDGNKISEVIDTLKRLKKINRPVLIHCQTIKGKGYKIAEGRYEKWHGVSPFDVESGKPLKSQSIQSPTSVFSKKLLELAQKHSDIVGVTAAMPSGTGLDKLMDAYPNRFFDVAIAEQHATTSMAAMAKEGLKPYVAIYSTFLQRAFDQIIHDVSIMGLPVRFCIDRAGIVGEDGETHQGLFDIAYLRMIPNMTMMAPRDNESLECILDFSVDISAPLAFRYPRGKFLLDGVESNFCKDDYKAHLSQWKSQMLERNDSPILIVGYGNGVGRGFLLKEVLKQKGVSADLLDLIFLKPLDSNTLLECFESYKYIFVLSDSYKINGVGAALLDLANSLYNERKLTRIPYITSFEDSFIRHGKSELVEESLGLDVKSLQERVLRIYGELS